MQLGVVERKALRCAQAFFGERHVLLEPGSGVCRTKGMSHPRS